MICWQAHVPDIPNYFGNSDDLLDNCAWRQTCQRIRNNYFLLTIRNAAKTADWTHAADRGIHFESIPNESLLIMKYRSNK